MNVGEDGDEDDRLRPGHLRGADGGEGAAGAVGLQNGEGTPPFHLPPSGPEPRGHRRKCGRSPNPRWGPSRARTGRARPYPGPTEPCAVGGGGGQSAGGPQSPLCVCVRVRSKSRPCWLPLRAKMGRRGAGGLRRSPGEVAGPLTTTAAIAARKEGTCCAAITAPPLSTSSAGKAPCSRPPAPRPCGWGPR